MRLIVRGLVAAVAFSLAPVALVATAAAPSNAATTIDTVSTSASTGTSTAQKPRSERVFRNMDVQSVSGKRQPTADVRVTPKFAKKLLVIQKKQGKGFKNFKKVRTNGKGKVRISVPGSRKGIKYRLVAPGNKKFLATKRVITARVF